LKTGISMQSEIASRLERLLGPGALIQDAPGQYAIDEVIPSAIVQPANADEIAAVLRIANEEDWVVAPFGGGTRQQTGRTPERVDVVLSTARLNKIEIYDPGDLTISLQSGVLVDDVLRECALHRQFLPLEAPPGATVGGALSAADSGPLRAGFGAPRDFCIGLSFITGDGVPGRGGGRVVKNVAGYDMMKLMIGSHGSLSVVTSANFKLFPRPTDTATFLCGFESLADLIRVRDWLLRSPLAPIAAEIINPAAHEYLSDSEARDPDHWAPEAGKAKATAIWQLALRFAGSEGVLARCRREVGARCNHELHGPDEAAFWQAFHRFEQRVLTRNRNAMLFQVSVPIAEVQSAIEAAEIAATNYNFVSAVVGRATVGALLIASMPLAIDPPSVTQFANAASDFRSRLSKAASAVVLRCPLEAKQHFDVWGSTPTDTELMQKIKRALDPKGVLNRGRFLVA
jgi:glycolate oxidase FAD binding subunit